MKTAIYTSIMGNYDALRPLPAQRGDVDSYCFTDHRHLPPVAGWNIVSLPFPRHTLSARLSAKYLKMLPHKIPQLQRYDCTVWIDGSMQILRDDFGLWATEQLASADLALCAHPDRDCVYDEAACAQNMFKYAGEPIDIQTQRYRERGYPAHAGLYACGFLARRSTASISHVMLDWWAEVCRYSFNDQISLPFICWLHDFSPHVLSANIWKNDHFAYAGHKFLMRDYLADRLWRVRRRLSRPQTHQPRRRP